MKKGFTLLELIIVIIIVGILATLGFVQYASVIERGRFAEARANLGTLRQLQIARHEDPMHGTTYGTLAAPTTDELGSGLPLAPSAAYYFTYECAAATGTCTATRDGTKATPPTAIADCTFILTVDGTMSGTCP